MHTVHVIFKKKTLKAHKKNPLKFMEKSDQPYTLNCPKTFKITITAL